MFYKQINTNSRNEMIDFLVNHFTYHILNSWNNCRGFANNVKIYNLNINKKLSDKAYDFIYNDNFWDLFASEKSALLEDFNVKYPNYTINSNGRNDGYLVLVNRNSISESLLNNKTDLEELETFELQDLVELVQDFDKTCDSIVNHFIFYLNNFQIKEVVETVQIKKKILVEI